MKRKCVEALLDWMEARLRFDSSFLEEEIGEYFAETFTILTNGRRIEASPETYREYLYQLKERLKSVHYEIEEILETSNAVVTSFVITLNYLEKEPDQLLAISIFRFNEQDKIIEWKEVFADLRETEFSYDNS